MKLFPLPCNMKIRKADVDNDIHVCWEKGLIVLTYEDMSDRLLVKRVVVWEFLQHCIRHKISVSVKQIIDNCSPEDKATQNMQQERQNQKFSHRSSTKKEWKCTSRHCKGVSQHQLSLHMVPFRGQRFVTAISIIFQQSI